ncbi:hypothetical protein PORY_000274 [Pneumocystis oryctolagi]|uniref:Uncharacterized protein n=1 Tax=Pneumocystis oryctolagi TaxID=42067 RepID=A0ACB7CER0_9ASCO|nr:hypothetical protein PORY_000274 [Pneumocystis oryctolagi]
MSHKNFKKDRREVGIEIDKVTDVTSVDFPGHFYGEENSWSLEEFKKKFHIENIVQKSPYDMEFDLIGIDSSIVNAFRRILMAEVPTMAIEYVFVNNNTSIIQDEILAQRLGLVPIKANPDLFTWFIKPDANQEPKPTDYDTVVLSLKVACTRNPKASKNETDPEKLYINSNVYSGDIQWQPAGRQIELFKDDPIRAVNDKILIAKLRPGQEIDITMHCILGIGQDHAKFSPVSTSSYRLLPTIHILEPIYDDDAEKFALCFPKGVIDIVLDEKNRKMAKVANTRNDTVSRECLRYDEFKDKVKLGRVRDHFIFSIESTGIITSEELFLKSIYVLKEKLFSLFNEIHENKSEVSDHSKNGYELYTSCILNRSGPFTNAKFKPGKDVYDVLNLCKVLVIGAGGLGCEILKNLAFSGFKHITIIDMDTVELSNFNRQFLFKYSDIGKSKAVCAAEYIMRHIKGVCVTPYHCKIQDKNESFYMQFNIIISGLDNIEGRRWINSMLVNMVNPESPESIKPFIDGGTEGFRGQVRVIFPTISSCYECSLDTHVRNTTYPICTIVNTPRLPEHCIEWALIIEWPKRFPNKPIDDDNPEHIKWIYETAKNRAKKFNITGITLFFTEGVVKNIIPTVASSNAIIAASCCNEAFKIVTMCNPHIDNYMMYTGTNSIYTYTFQYQKKSDCPVCGYLAIMYEVSPKITLNEFIEKLKNSNMHISKPSLRTKSKSLYFQAPLQLEEATKSNLDRLIEELVNNGEDVLITDPSLPFTLNLKLKYI